VEKVPKSDPPAYGRHPAFDPPPPNSAQASLEQLEVEAAKDRAKAARGVLVAQGKESATEYGRALFNQYGEAVKIGVDALLSRFAANPGMAGPHFEALPLLLHFKDKGLGPIAAVALGAVLDTLTRRQRYSALARAIGRRIEDEVRAMAIEDKSPDLLRLLKKRSGGRKKQVVGTVVMGQLQLRREPWAAGDRRAVGALLLDVVIVETGLVRLINASQRQPMVEPTEKALAMAKECPPRPAPAKKLPMLMPPRPWPGLYGGGHYSNTQPLVSCRVPRDLGYFEQADLSPALQVINSLQEQQMAIDPWMVDMQRQAWDSNLPDLFPVRREPLSAPRRPEDEGDRKAWKEWQKEAVKAWHDEREGNKQRVRIEQAIRQCEQAGSQPVWFAYDMDFRGRVYSSNRYATHQGPDWEKAAVSFARGEPCDEDAADWILKAAAGHFGLGKATWQERLDWGRNNIDRLVAAAESPLDQLDLWAGASDPWQFLQMARAFRSWLGDPAHPIGVPIRFDQTTSGPGILAALVRDRRIAESCNLIGDRPNDLYGVVAARVRDVLRSDLEAGDMREQRHAAFWLERGVDRKLAKGPVMTTTYGAQYQGLVDGLVELLTQEVGLLQPWEYESKLLAPSRYLAKRLLATLKEEVQPCLAVQEWLRKLSAVVVKTQQPIEWTSPMGFPIRLGVQMPSRSKVQTLMSGAPSWQTLMDKPKAGELSARATNRSITAHLVHSFDAALVHAIVYRGASQGAQLLVNHDCFAATPSRSSWLHHTLHDELRVMYMPDWLADITAEVKARTGIEKLPPPPIVGDLCPGEIGQNPYCFS
jgi:DNA-directed RNA polymerase, mitochondrial